MQNITQEIMQTLCELQELMRRQKANGVADAKSDRFGFDYEPEHMISMEPLTILETAIRLQTAAFELFDMAVKVNRHSPLFSRISGRLEKIVGQLGTCCITKAVMEQQGETFPEIKLITMEELRRMTAFNLRKSYESFMESSAFGNCNRSAFDLMISWSAMDRRLLATAEKIEKIKAGTVKVDISEKESVPAAQKETEKAAEKETAPLSEKASALPVDKSALRGAGMQKTAGTQPEMAAEQAQEPEQARTEGSSAEGSAEAAAPGSIDEMDEDEKIIRHILMQDAVDRADREAYESVYRARGLDLTLLWNAYLLRENEKDLAELEKSLGDSVPEDPPPEKESPGSAKVYALETA